MIRQENITTIKRLGVESGTVEILCLSESPRVIIEFVDENSPGDLDVDFILEDIELGEPCFIKESRVIGGIDLHSVKTSEEEETVTRLLNEEVRKMKPELIAKAKAYAEEIRERAGIPVEVVEEIQGEPGVMTEYAQNMWHAREVMRGIDDDY
ncbi:hypothetical protein QMA09_16760 [Planococcus sp. APC 3906]|uniref:hypothetical protein n=1 Tax=Planococcus sp. APC 3906 TaxID=3035194 RepID=UPI0025B589DB|nr:hypothetical protein [Planococcus sp. APC 3906]MDN3451843.1 hypothetical protein [Planococcus sp. APC 3906]